MESAEATLREVAAAYERQKTLLSSGFTTQTNAWFRLKEPKQQNDQELLALAEV